MRLRFVLPVSLMVVTALAATTGSVQARAVVDPAVAVKAKTFVIGSGFGHGHGMSQYGAQGGAQAGRTASQILAFYYPGTTSATYNHMVRVLITANTRPTTIVLAQDGLKVTDLGRNQTWALPTGKRAWRLSVVGGATQVSYLTTTWHPYAPGGHASFLGVGQFSSTSSTLTLRTPSGDRRYRGRMRLIYGHTVNVLNLDNYVRGVIPTEMPTEWLPAALQAQAIAARTYAAYEMEHFASRSYEVCDTSACQVYGGLGTEAASSNAAVLATSGKILSYRGAPAFTQFTSSDGGWTAAGGEPYLPFKQDPWDVAYRNWKTPLDTAALQAAFPGLGALTSVQTARAVPYAQGGRVDTVVLTFSKGKRTVTGGQFRDLLGLRSTLFAVSTPAS